MAKKEHKYMFTEKVAVTAPKVTVRRPGLVKLNIYTCFITLVFQP